MTTLYKSDFAKLAEMAGRNRVPGNFSRELADFLATKNSDFDKERFLSAVRVAEMKDRVEESKRFDNNLMKGMREAARMMDRSKRKEAKNWK